MRKAALFVGSMELQPWQMSVIERADERYRQSVPKYYAAVGNLQEAYLGIRKMFSRAGSMNLRRYRTVLDRALFRLTCPSV